MDGRWWFVCPDGHLFYSSGLNGVGTGAGTRVEGREDLFARLPPATPAPGRRGGAMGGSFYTWNLQRRYGDDWRTNWADLTTRRLAAWGFNTVHNWGAPNRGQAEPRVPYAMMMRGWQTGARSWACRMFMRRICAKRVDEAAASQLAPFRDDPWMLGYLHRQRTTLAGPRKPVVRLDPQRRAQRNAETAQSPSRTGDTSSAGRRSCWLRFSITSTPSTPP